MKEMIYKPDIELEILDEGHCGGFHYCIVSYGTHPAAYVEIPSTHRFYKMNHRDMDILCYGDLSYSSAHGILRNEHYREGFWIGWDYNHCGDYNGSLPFLEGFKKWTTEEIYEHIQDVVFQLLHFPKQLKLIGYWIAHMYGTTLDPCCYEYICSLCGKSNDIPASFCPNCYKPMEEKPKEQNFRDIDFKQLEMRWN